MIHLRMTQMLSSRSIEVFLERWANLLSCSLFDLSLGTRIPVTKKESIRNLFLCNSHKCTSFVTSNTNYNNTVYNDINKKKSLTYKLHCMEYGELFLLKRILIKQEGVDTSFIIRVFQQITNNTELHC